MNDDELRRLVREAVARQLGAGQSDAGRAPTTARPGGQLGADTWSGHPSHHLYLTVVNSNEACVIEPSVACNHCGYCKSHGH